MDNYFYFNGSKTSSESLEESINYTVGNYHVNNLVGSETNELSSNCSSELQNLNSNLNEYVDSYAKVQSSNNCTNQYSDVIYHNLNNELLENSENSRVNYCYVNNSATSENELSHYGISREDARNSLSYEYVDGNANVQDTNNFLTQYLDNPLPELSNEILEILQDLENYSATPENEFSNYGSSEENTQNNFSYEFIDGNVKVQDQNDSITQNSYTSYLELNNELLESLEDSRNYRVDYCHVNNSVGSRNELSSNNSSESRTQRSHINEHADVGGIVQSPSCNSNQYSDAIHFNSHNDQPVEEKKIIRSLKASNQSLHNIETCDKESCSQVYDTTPKPLTQVLDYHSPNKKTLPSIVQQDQQKSPAHVVVPGNQNISTYNQTPRRNRTNYTTEQKIILEKAFSENQYLKITETEVLSKQLNIDEKKIKVWFQNRRHKERKSESLGTVPVADCSQKIDDVLKKLKCNTNSRQ